MSNRRNRRDREAARVSQVQNSSLPPLNSADATGKPPIQRAGPDILDTNITPDSPRLFPKLLKALLWRTTGIYVWVRIILAICGADNFVVNLSSSLLQWFAAALTMLVGYPVDAGRLSTVVKVGWILLMAEFMPFQIVSFIAYLVAFPVWFSFYLIFRKPILDNRKASQNTAKAGLRPAKRHVPVVSSCVFGLLAWYVLFAGAPNVRTVWAALILSGLLTLSLAYRAFRSAAPTTGADTAPLLSTERGALGTMKNCTNIVLKAKEKLPTRLDAMIHKTLYRVVRWYYVTLADSIRGKSGRTLISSMIVFAYAVTLVFLAGSAVLFWTFAAQILAPGRVLFSTCFLFSVSHFLPGLGAPSVPFKVPLWLAIGPGITAWVLLSVYVAASTSLLPGKQLAYTQRLPTTYLVLRKTVLSIKATLRLMDAVLAHRAA